MLLAAAPSHHSPDRAHRSPGTGDCEQLAADLAFWQDLLATARRRRHRRFLRAMMAETEYRLAALRQAQAAAAMRAWARPGP